LNLHDEVVVLILLFLFFDEVAYILECAMFECFHFDLWSFEHAVRPVNVRVEFPEPQIAEDESILAQVCDVESLT